MASQLTRVVHVQLMPPDICLLACRERTLYEELLITVICLFVRAGFLCAGNRQ